MNKHTKLDGEVDIDRLISEYDDTFMPLPDIEFEPHLLISKVRKHYMEHMIKMLSANYETNQRLVNKNIYLPSAIWKCAKRLEMKAAQTCMVVQLYRKCIVSTINEVKTETKRGRLYNKLFESLHIEPKNEKRTQTTGTGENCQCYDKKRRKKRSSPVATAHSQVEQSRRARLDQRVEQSRRASLNQRVEQLAVLLQEKNNMNDLVTHKIPVVTNMQIDHLPAVIPPAKPVPEVFHSKHNPQQPGIQLPYQPSMTPNNVEQESDDLMMQLEKLFQDDHDDDDLFTSTLIDDNNKQMPDGLLKPPNGTLNMQDAMLSILDNTQDSVIENHAAQIKSLDERLATLTGLLANNEPGTVPPQQKVVQKKQKHISKWHCEEYFLKKNLFEMLYQIGDNNRNKLARIKEMYRRLFGADSDDEEGIVSPADSPDFVASCKARIDLWVRLVLAPSYTKGRIQGKLLYKSVARHLIELIYKCKQYPSRHEVTSFVMDFLENRGQIRCEADFKEFRIDNVHVPTYSVTY